MRGVALVLTWMAVHGACAANEGEGIPAPETEPRIINPGPPPSDAVVLFAGTDLSAWEHPDGKPAQWKLADGAMEVVKKSGAIQTKQAFGSCQLHLEWATPAEVEGEGQKRGNSGVYFMGEYEVQVLDSYHNTTYFHGQAAGIYKQHAPLVNACRPPGEWQTYDIIFHAPVFEGERVVKSATFTVLQNGVLVQDHVEALGRTVNKGMPKYFPHAAKRPLSLQEHGNPVRFRNIWIREL